MNSPAGNRTFVVSALAGLVLCVLSEPFGTSVLPVATRTLLWAALIGVNALKWWAWYHFVAPRFGGGRRADLAAAAVGALVLNLTLPLEVAFVYRAVGLDVELDWLWLYLVAGVISLLISSVVAAATRAGPTVAAEVAAPQAAGARGIAARPDAARLIAVTAEDHYVRLHLDGGGGPLLLRRFGDALADLRALDGEQVHRGAWVAARGVTGADRQGRRWTLRLSDGARVPVSDRHLPAVRARGWLG